MKTIKLNMLVLFSILMLSQNIDSYAQMHGAGNSHMSNMMNNSLGQMMTRLDGMNAQLNSMMNAMHSGKMMNGNQMNGNQMINGNQMMSGNQMSRENNHAMNQNGENNGHMSGNMNNGPNTANGMMMDEQMFKHMEEMTGNMNNLLTKMKGMMQNDALMNQPGMKDYMNSMLDDMQSMMDNYGIIVQSLNNPQVEK